jgi:hypothetical protein
MPSGVAIRDNSKKRSAPAIRPKDLGTFGAEIPTFRPKIFRGHGSG